MGERREPTTDMRLLRRTTRMCSASDRTSDHVHHNSVTQPCAPDRAPMHFYGLRAKTRGDIGGSGASAARRAPFARGGERKPESTDRRGGLPGWRIGVIRRAAPGACALGGSGALRARREGARGVRGHAGAPRTRVGA